MSKNKQQPLIPKTKKAPQPREAVTASVMEFRSAPIPSAEEMERYQALYPDAPRIFLEAFKEQGKHRREMEKINLQRSFNTVRLGQWFAFILALTALSGGIWLISTNKSVQGFGLIITALIPLIGAFLFGRQKKEDKENE